MARYGKPTAQSPSAPSHQGTKLPTSCYLEVESSFCFFFFRALPPSLTAYIICCLLFLICPTRLFPFQARNNFVSCQRRINPRTHPENRHRTLNVINPRLRIVPPLQEKKEREPNVKPAHALRPAFHRDGALTRRTGTDPSSARLYLPTSLLSSLSGIHP